MTGWEGGKGLDPHVLARFEAEFGVRLPEGYKSVVLEHDGGEPTHPMMPYRVGGRDTAAMIGLIPFVRRTSGGTTMETTARLVREERPSLVPFADDGGGYEACFDYAGGAEPTVVFLDPDEPEPVPVAASWENFLAKLEPWAEVDLDGPEYARRRIR